MYLSHHYAVDLVAGSLLSATAYFIAKGKFLPRLQAGKMFRWDYDYVEVGEAKEGFAYGLTDLDDDFHHHDSADEWTIGSSSSIASPSRSPSVGTRSPTELRSPVDESWEGETLASTSDHEYQKS